MRLMWLLVMFINRGEKQRLVKLYEAFRRAGQLPPHTEFVSVAVAVNCS